MNLNNNIIRKLVFCLIAGVSILFMLSGCSTQQQLRGWAGVALNDNQMYTCSMNGVISGYDVTNRDKLFNDIKLVTATSGSFLSCGPSSVSTFVYGTPALAPELDLMFVAGYNGKVYCYSMSKGVERWRYPREGNIKPIIGSILYKEEKIYFGTNNGEVYALDARTGDLIWQEPFKTGSKIWSKPAIEGDVLYITSFDKKLYALNIRDGSEKWHYEVNGAIVCTPLVDGKTVYFGSFDRYFYAVRDGKLVWKSSDPANNWFWSNPIMVDGIVYAANVDGYVYAFDAGSGKLVNSYKIGYAISSSPVLLDNENICVATQNGEVWSLNTRTGETDKRYDYRAKRNNKRINIYAPLAVKGSTVYVVTTDNRLNALVTTQTDSSGFWLEPWTISLGQ